MGPLAFASIVVDSSSKNFRQSSLSSSSPSCFASSSSDDDSPFAIFFLEGFAFGGLAPNSVTHHSLSSFCSVGKVVKRSRMDKRLTGRFGVALVMLFVRIVLHKVVRALGHLR